MSDRALPGGDEPGGAPAGVPSGYPAELVHECRTRTGLRVLVRPIRPDDAAGLAEFHRQLSARSVYRRFFFVHPRLSDAEVARFTAVDYRDRLALVAEEGGRMAAVGRYDRTPGTDDAEVAFVVTDDLQHQGIGTLLLQQLAAAARCRGIETFSARTLVENRDMLHVFVDSGFPATTAFEDGTISVRFRSGPTRRCRWPRPCRIRGTPPATRCRGGRADPGRADRFGPAPAGPPPRASGAPGGGPGGGRRPPPRRRAGGGRRWHPPGGRR